MDILHILSERYLRKLLFVFSFLGKCGFILLLFQAKHVMGDKVKRRLLCVLTLLSLRQKQNNNIVSLLAMQERRNVTWVIFYNKLRHGSKIQSQYLEVSILL